MVKRFNRNDYFLRFFEFFFTPRKMRRLAIFQVEPIILVTCFDINNHEISNMISAHQLLLHTQRNGELSTLRSIFIWNSYNLSSSSSVQQKTQKKSANVCHINSMETNTLILLLSISRLMLLCVIFSTINLHR